MLSRIVARHCQLLLEIVITWRRISSFLRNVVNHRLARHCHLYSRSDSSLEEDLSFLRGCYHPSGSKAAIVHCNWNRSLPEGHLFFLSLNIVHLGSNGHCHCFGNRTFRRRIPSFFLDIVTNRWQKAFVLQLGQHFFSVPIANKPILKQ